MANQPPHYPTNSNLNTPPSVSSQSNAPFTPRSSSIADDSDAEFDPTPLQSPRGGPDYDDLPPSYDEAQHQAVSDARNGVTPLDPNQIEAHRLTLNEGPNEPEIWEYRIRGEELNEAEEHERAPEYENFTNDLGTSVPVQHVQSSDNIPVGQVGVRSPVSSTAPISLESLVNRALGFTQQKPDADVQYAPRLTQRIAIPQLATLEEHQEHGNPEPIQFLRAYGKALHAHSIQPAEFMAFLDGLNALCVASALAVDELLTGTLTKNGEPSVVQDYIQSANDKFFAPRGLRVSLQSLAALINALDVPTKRGQRSGALVSILDHTTTVERRAAALCPWVESLDTAVPAPVSQSLLLQDMAERLRQQSNEGSTPSAAKTSKSRPKDEEEDPPHSIPEPPADHGHMPHGGPRGGRRHGRGRGGPHGGNRGPFGSPGRGPFGTPGGRSGRGRSLGGRSRGRFGPPGHGPPPFAHHRGADRAGGPDAAQCTNEWAALGQNLGKWGEEFGKRMGDWGQQFGKQAENWGQDVGKRAEVWSGEVAAQASGSGSRGRPGTVQAHADDALPLSYEEGPSSQESGILRGDSKDTGGPPSYDDVSKQPTQVEKDDDAPSFSSDSSDSDSDLDSDSDSDDGDEEFPDTEATFLRRLQSINKQAEESARKGKKGPEEIAQERALAIEEAQEEKTFMEIKIAKKLSKRALQREMRQKRRDLKREHRHKKRDLRAAHTGKGKGKAKKSPEWKQARKEYREKKKELKKERLKAKKDLRDARTTNTRGNDAISAGDQRKAERMVWVVIENLEI